MKLLSQKLQKVWETISQPKFLFYFIAVWVAVVLLSGIRFGDLSGYDDAAYAHEGRAILESGDWWTLSFNGNPDFDKPPLFIWLIAISFKIFGINDFTAKLPTVILGWATIISVYFLAKELISDASRKDNEWIPVLSMLCLATTQYFLKYSSHAMTDVPFTFFFTLAIYFYLRGLKNGRYWLGSGVAIGLAMLTRSPIGFFPLGIIFFHLLYLRRFKSFFSPYMIGLVFLAITIPGIWYWQEYQIHGEYFLQRHFNNVVAHSATTDARTSGQQVLWYFQYLFLIIKLYLPWFPLMFYGLYLCLRKIKNKNASFEMLLLIWLLVVLLPFSIAESKVLRYILPVFPVFSVLVAYSLNKLLGPNYLPVFSRSVVFLLTLAAFIIVAFPNYQRRADDMREIAPLSDAATEANEKVFLYTFGELHWNYQTQLIWYGKRNTLLLKEKKELEEHLLTKKELVVVMDKTSFDSLSQTTSGKIIMLGESEKFVCFRLLLKNMK